MSEWKEVSLSELGKTITGKTPSSQYPEDFGDEVPFITPSDSFEKKYISRSERYLSRLGSDRLKDKIISSDSIMVTCIGSAMGKVAKNSLPSVTNQQINSIIVNENFDSDYIYYLFKNNYAVFRNAASGSTAIPILNKTYFDNLRFKVELDLNQQRKMVSILSKIDAKIEINNQINQELEAMAKTLYDYWFLQFDFPDQNGKPYKSSGGKMVYNPELKREIPEGWGVEKLGDIANITMGQSPKGTSYNEVGEGMLFFQGSTDFGWRFPVARQYTTEPSRIAEEDDILLSVRAPVGTLNIADTRCCIGRGLAAINSKVGVNSYIFNVMQDFKKLFDMRNSVGTTFGSITKDDLYSLQLVYPPNELLMKFDQSVKSFDREIKNRSRQNQGLTQLRDWLLPMLMNGQVKVK
ncbi:type I restriction endonuclease [Streptococcus sp. HMSC078H03]|uniref:restriction endonuclease subunit S n=1 Tax=Streptococcus sp. HMSC078H03 TaxID=1715086 RepID=UPI0008A35A25|nr:restriction endonuclease subunit S [Streptococcus sp. HMSC078H03]OFO00503.1 type I restriction endonuclease [Streptococcus sp. HMSC078H03]